MDAAVDSQDPPELSSATALRVLSPSLLSPSPGPAALAWTRAAATLLLDPAAAPIEQETVITNLQELVQLYPQAPAMAELLNMLAAEQLIHFPQTIGTSGLAEELRSLFEDLRLPRVWSKQIVVATDTRVLHLLDKPAVTACRRQIKVGAWEIGAPRWRWSHPGELSCCPVCQTHGEVEKLDRDWLPLDDDEWSRLLDAGRQGLMEALGAEGCSVTSLRVALRAALESALAVELCAIVAGHLDRPSDELEGICRDLAAALGRGELVPALIL